MVEAGHFAARRDLGAELFLLLRPEPAIPPTPQAHPRAHELVGVFEPCLALQKRLGIVVDSIRRLSLIHTLLTAAPSSRVPSASGERRIGAAIKRCSKPTVPSSRRRPRKQVRRLPTIGPPEMTDLTDTFAINYGADRRGSALAWIQRTASNIGSMWVATGTGRLFVSDNTNAPAGAVTWQRVDPNPTHANTPNRYISSIYVDPANAHHAWISYSGYNANTPAQPGHVFEATWADRARRPSLIGATTCPIFRLLGWSATMQKVICTLRLTSA